jgi:Domain of unknown function (DUF4276)
MAAKKHRKVVLFIEGTTDETNGDLRQGFERLLAKEANLQGKMPRIVLGNGISQTIDKFINAHEDHKFVMVDMDGNYDKREEKLKFHKVENEDTFFMVQAVEAWFLSQPLVLNAFYKKDLSDKITKKAASDFSKPDKELQRITKDTVRKEYHKVRHAVELLPLLDAKKLAQDFPDYKRLIETLTKI